MQSTAFLLKKALTDTFRCKVSLFGAIKAQFKCSHLPTQSELNEQTLKCLIKLL